MKRAVIIIVSSIVGALLLAGGFAFAAVKSYQNTVHFDVYDISSVYTFKDEEGRERAKQLQAEGYVIKSPSFYLSQKLGCADELVECYYEVDNAAREYAMLVAKKFDNRAKLDCEVDCTPTVLTIIFSGEGYYEDGSTEKLERTYIFDIDGAGRDKLPVLLNRSEIFGT